jgi:ubiquitin-conjugating enzyme E2 G1
MQQAKDLPGISCGLVGDNVFEWEVMLMISDDCKYYGGTPRSLSLPFLLPLPPTPPNSPKTNATTPTKGANFSARLSFPPSYPLLPPTMTFLQPIPFHPNVYTNGLVCISILHPPEDDKYGYESAAERWSPVQTPETILLSVISLLHGPNDESPANVEAARLWREEQKGGKSEGAREFRRRCRKCVRESLGED